MNTDRTDEEIGMQIGYDRGAYGVSRPDLDAMGERAVRDALNSGKYGHAGLPVFAYVSAWLADAAFAKSEAESVKRDAREEESLSISRLALFNSARANTIAIRAAILATVATIIAAVIGVMYGSK